MTRPSVSVIVPFAGAETELAELLTRLQRLHLRADDQIIVADNRRGRPPARNLGKPSQKIEVVMASAIPTPAFARNQAAKLAAGEWLVFIDADTVPEPSLLDAHFRPAPGPRTAVLAGRVDDALHRSTLIARHAVARRRMSQRATLERTGRPYAQTANCAVLRAAFEEVGGFVEAARAGEDADLCFRLLAGGWGLEERPSAAVSHLSRSSLKDLIGQLMVHGSGAAWVERRHPGTFPRPSAAELIRRLAHSLREALWSGVRGERERAEFALLDLAGTCAFELGRLRSNLRRGLPDADAG